MARQLFVHEACSDSNSPSITKLVPIPSKTWGIYNNVAPQFDLADPCGLPYLSTGGYMDMLVIDSTDSVGIVLVANETLDLGSIARSVNYGESFSNITVPMSGYINKFFLTNLGTVIAFSGAYCSRSTNNGATFEAAVNIGGIGYLGTVAQLPSGRIVGSQGGYDTYYSDDDGLTWQLGGGTAVGAICYSSTGSRLVSVAPSGVAKYSSDGISWSTVAMPSYISVSPPVDANGVLICMRSDGTSHAKSVDGGLTWVSGSESLINSGNWYRAEYLPLCKLALAFHNNPTGDTYVMCGTSSLFSFVNIRFPVTQNPVRRVIGSVAKGLIFVLTSKLLYRVPVI